METRFKRDEGLHEGVDRRSAEPRRGRVSFRFAREAERSDAAQLPLSLPRSRCLSTTTTRFWEAVVQAVGRSVGRWVG